MDSRIIVDEMKKANTERRRLCAIIHQQLAAMECQNALLNATTNEFVRTHLSHHIIGNLLRIMNI